jgi:hypothetical protein
VPNKIECSFKVQEESECVTFSEDGFGYVVLQFSGGSTLGPGGHRPPPNVAQAPQIFGQRIFFSRQETIKLNGRNAG